MNKLGTTKGLRRAAVAVAAVALALPFGLTSVAGAQEAGDPPPMDALLDQCPERSATGYTLTLTNNLSEAITPKVNGTSEELKPDEERSVTVAFDEPLVITLDGERVYEDSSALACVGPLSILVAEPVCPATTPVVEETILLNRVAVPVTFTVDDVEATLEAGALQTFDGTGPDPKVMVGGRQQPLINEDPVVAQPAVGCPEEPPSSPGEPPSSPSSPSDPAPLSPKFTG